MASNLAAYIAIVKAVFILNKLNEKAKYSVVVPMYNEEEVITESYKRLTETMEKTGEPYELVFVNDGSRDKSAEIIRELSKTDASVRLVDFSRNFGHQSAVTAGMDFSTGDAVVLIDADLQDPPQVILQMIEKWKEGYDVVFGVRKARSGETAFKKATAKIYYRLLRSLSDVEIPVDTGDFRLMDRQVIIAMKSLSERNRFVRGLVSWVGFKQYALEYNREPRFAGETKYPLKKMIKFALDGIMSFSYKPLRITAAFGFLISLISFIYLVVIILEKLFFKTAIQGWASTTAVITFTQGIVLLMLGIIGGYIGRIYDEVKGRPNYIVRETLGFEKKPKSPEEY